MKALWQQVGYGQLDVLGQGASGSDQAGPRLRALGTRDYTSLSLYLTNCIDDHTGYMTEVVPPNWPAYRSAGISVHLSVTRVWI